MRTHRSAAATLVVALALILADAATGQEQPADVAGSWAITVETAAGSGSPTVTLKQDGEALTGTYSSQIFGDQKVTGNIKGTAITFSFTASVEGNSVTVTYTGTVEKTTIKGKVTLGELGEGTFTAKKTVEKER